MENSSYTRKKESELSKQLIIDAAIHIGSESDWHHVTFQSIADWTGLSKGGIIHHFRNKEELLDELVNQSLINLTDKVKKYRDQNVDKDGAFAYLKFILEKKNDEKYAKTMRIILQAIMINSKYRLQWEDWYNLHILPTDGEELSIHSTIVFLVADAIWYSENMGSIHLTEKDKPKVLNFLQQLK